MRSLVASPTPSRATCSRSSIPSGRCATTNGAALPDIVGSPVRVTEDTRGGRDFGCGNGGLVRFVRQNPPCHIAGDDEVRVGERTAAAGIPFPTAAAWPGGGT